jgi:hypothetical protein
MDWDKLVVKNDKTSTKIKLINCHQSSELNNNTNFMNEITTLKMLLIIFTNLIVTTNISSERHRLSVQYLGLYTITTTQH